MRRLSFPAKSEMMAREASGDRIGSPDYRGNYKAAPAFCGLVEAAPARPARDALRRGVRCKNRHPRAKHREIITAT